MTTPKTFDELHNSARSDMVQYACNLSGLVRSFSDQIMPRLWEICREENRGGTDWVNSNAVTRLWIDKMRSLAGEPTTEDWNGELIDIDVTESPQDTISH